MRTVVRIEEYAMIGRITNPEIVIVGAGPSGLALATELYRLGAQPLVVDRLSEGVNTSRAAVVHARTLEVLTPMGATAAVLEKGIKVALFRVRDRDKILFEVDFSGLDTPFPYTVMCPQNSTEKVLLDCLHAAGGSVERPIEVAALRSGPNAVEMDVRTATGERTLQAPWVVGCDGAHSVVRKATNVTFDGGTYEESFVLADVHMDWPLSREEVSLFFAPEGLVVVAPLPGDRYRIVATVDQAPERLDAAYFQHILDMRGPQSKVARVDHLVWSSPFRLQHRVASTPRLGRIILCGDAAHVHSPAGGQGMNTGIQDAISLAEPLLIAAREGATDALDAWARRRHEIADGVVTMTDRMTRAATLRSYPARLLRNAALEIAGHVPGVADKLARMLSELDNR
jgi:2-polyprenyl-6-methoxyphenol hydroxylase-like FAD-dependent oxidoreductase